MKDKLGICQWFHYRDYQTVARAAELLEELGVRHLRTGLSWADYHRPGGPDWYRWMFEQLKHFELLVSVWHTPPSYAEGNVCNGPPKRLLNYADFIWQINREYGEYFDSIELWNEPNNRYKWNFHKFDPKWRKFATMVAAAAHQARADRKATVLGGIIPVDHRWLQLMKSYDALEDMDVIAIHGFPEMWWPDRPNWDWASHWQGWEAKVGYISCYCDGRPIWITETGLATWDAGAESEGRFELQARMLQEAASAPAGRIYWYSLIDLDPEQEAIEGFHVDENEYHLGLVDWEGNRKAAFDAFAELLNEPASPRALRASCS